MCIHLQYREHQCVGTLQRILYISQTVVWVFASLRIGYMWLFLLILHSALFYSAFICICMWVVMESTCKREWHPLPHSFTKPHLSNPSPCPVRKGPPVEWLLLLPGCLLISLCHSYQTSLLSNTSWTELSMNTQAWIHPGLLCWLRDRKLINGIFLRILNVHGLPLIILVFFPRISH